MIKRKNTKQLMVGDVMVGGGAPITVQSMCNTDTRDVKSTLEQINRLSEAGCEIIRLAVLNEQAADAIKTIKKQSKIPIVADIHFDYRLAIKSIESGVDALRLNPGNIGKEENIKKVISLAKANQIPIRIGVNSGSLEKDIALLEISKPEQMLKSALRHIKILEDNDFDLIKVSLKSSDVPSTIEAYRLLSEQCNYPLHLGITESGTLKSGVIKSSVGIGTLLAMGIGDTIRVSLTDSPVEEVRVGFEILKSLHLREKGVNFVSCPTCGRCQIDLISLAQQIEAAVAHIDRSLTIAVMGCAVNGPGEAKSADFGVAGGIDEVYIFAKGEIVKKVPQDRVVAEFLQLITSAL